MTIVYQIGFINILYTANISLLVQVYDCFEQTVPKPTYQCMMLTRNKFNKTFIHVYKCNNLMTIMTDYDVTMNCCLEGKN